MDFYYGRLSGNSLRVAFGLYEAGVPFTARLVDRPQAQHRAPEYLALNPMGKVPTLTDGDLQLWESNAINWYVAETFPSAAHLLPNSPAGRAQVQRWLFFQAAHVSPACMPILRVTNERMRSFWGAKADPQAAEAARVELARYLLVLEQALGDGEWLEGAFSLADIAYAPHLWLLTDEKDEGYDFTKTPAVHAWLRRLWSRTAWNKAVALTFGA